MTNGDVYPGCAHRVSQASDSILWSEGYHLAGAIDGEGSFNIIRRAKGKAYGCLFALGLRADDEEFVRLLRSWAGEIGNVYIARRNPKNELKHPRNSKPVAMWVVTRPDDCRRLAAILDEFPLRSKKRRDYEVWREALDAWAERNWGRMAVLFDLIRQVREYDAPEFEIPVDGQLQLPAAAFGDRGEA